MHDISYAPSLLSYTEKTLEQSLETDASKTEFGTEEIYSYGAEFDASISDALYAKNIGISRILSFFEAEAKILDVLGGSGQIRLAYDQFLRHPNALDIITGDIESHMVSCALGRGIDAILVDACDMSNIDSGTYAGVIIAYGFHHLPTELRVKAIKEAVRVTKKGGIVVVHDGIYDGCTDKLTRVTVDKYGKCPHIFCHPEREELIRYVRELKNINYTEYDIFDPQMFLGESARSAYDLMCNYYIKHYGLPEAFKKTLLADEIRNVFEGHMFHPDEIQRLHPGDKWVIGKPYEKGLYIGEIESDLMSRAFPLAKSLDAKHSHMAVVPRYAKSFVIEV